jgi:KDO2-lipid IV(A) lauroyltransferase
MFKYFLYKFGQFCVTRLPLKWVYRIAVFLSDLQYYLSPNDRRAVKNNLRVILPLRENINSLSKEVFRNFGKYLVEFFRMPTQLNRDYLRDHVKVKNLDYLQKVLQQGKGAIVLTAHLGNWEAGAMVLSLLGYPIMVIALSHKERPVNRLFNIQREATGVKVVPIHLAMRRCLETLKNNQLVGMAADRDFTASGEEIEFLGKKTLIPKGAAVLSSRTGAPILPTFLIRERDDTFTLMIHPPLYPPKLVREGEVERQVILSIMKEYTAILEEEIRQYPTQWLMFREFWRRNEEATKAAGIEEMRVQ